MGIVCGLILIPPDAVAGPTAVVVNPPTDVTSYSLNLTWSQNDDTDFELYEVYVSSQASLLGNLFATHENRSATGSFIFGLEPSTAYFFIVHVGSALGEFAASNQVTATTLPASGETVETQPEEILSPSTVFLVFVAAAVVMIAALVAVRSRRSHSRR